MFLCAQVFVFASVHLVASVRCGSQDVVSMAPPGANILSLVITAVTAMCQVV